MAAYPNGVHGAGTIRWQISGDTDVGGSHENQDDYFIWENKNLGICVLCVLDGHGREVGKTAAMAAKSFLLNFFDKYHHELLSMPYECLVRAHLEAHACIKGAFKVVLQQNGWEVLDYKDYLLKRKKIKNNISNSNNTGWQCVHGGTSCSIVALVNDCLYVANVGDSSATLCCANYISYIAPDQTVHTTTQICHNLNNNDMLYIGDSDSNSINNQKNDGELYQTTDEMNHPENMDDSCMSSVMTDMEGSTYSNCSDSNNSILDSKNSNNSVTNSTTSVNTSTSMNSISTSISSSSGNSSIFGFTTRTRTVTCDSNVSVGNDVEYNLNMKHSLLSGKAKEMLLKHERRITRLGNKIASNSNSYTNNNTEENIEDSSTLLITTEHSPESMTEYIRFCAFRPHPDPVGSLSNLIPHPELLTIYDESQIADKSKCPCIFGPNLQNQLSVTNNGRYYKNVRKEWASLVAVPPTAKFHDALAFTRSLGDFHLHTYGIFIFIITVKFSVVLD